METESLSSYSHGFATDLFPTPGESCPYPTPFSQISQLTGQQYNLQMKSAQVAKYLSCVMEISVCNLAPGTNYSEASRGYPQFIQPNDGRVP
jgi:hypothetical protein